MCQPGMRWHTAALVLLLLLVSPRYPFAQPPALSLQRGALVLDGDVVAKVTFKLQPLPSQGMYIPLGDTAIIDMQMETAKIRVLDPWGDVEKANPRGDIAYWTPLLEIGAKDGKRIVVYGLGQLKRDCLTAGNGSRVELRLQVPLDRCDLMRFVVIEPPSKGSAEHVYGFSPCSGEMVFCDRWLRGK